MVTVLKVDTAVLADVRLQMIHVAARLTGSGSGADAIAQLGVRSAAHTFDHAWEYRMRKASDTAEGGATTLKSVIDAYRAVDHALSAALGRTA